MTLRLISIFEILVHDVKATRRIEIADEHSIIQRAVFLLLEYSNWAYMNELRTIDRVVMERLV